MPSSLPRSTPADQRVDPAAVLSFLDAMDDRPDIEMHSLSLGTDTAATELSASSA
jgi:hypothetical protein